MKIVLKKSFSSAAGGSRQHDKFPGDRLNMVAAVLSSDVRSSVETGDAARRAAPASLAPQQKDLRRLIFICSSAATRITSVVVS
jgi:hypothetical protein